MHHVQGDARMLESRRVLGILRGCLRRARRDAERSLRLVEISAQVAWVCHAGTFVLPDAETVLREHAGLSDPLATVAADARRVEHRTLHVVTEAYAIGGHTRLVKRWIDLIDDETHAVVLVRQRHGFDPAWIIPQGRDVPCIDLEGERVGPRARVARLIAMFQAARRVILHIHPDDACAVAAAYRSPRADIHFLNHADHVAWLGAGLPAVLLNLRHRGTRLAESRRGIAAAACGVVPVPITPPAAIDRDEARERLGIGAHERVILTIASGYKYNAVGGRSLLEPLDRVLRRRDTRLVAVGPEPGHPVFAALAERHPGRVLCMGTVQVSAAHRAAADVYLDSYPFASITSMLESAALGTPVVAYQPDRDELEILYSECPWFPPDAYAAGDPGRLVEMLDERLDDEALRRDLSARNQAGMAMHFPEAWRTAIRAHLSRDVPKVPWRGRGIGFRDDRVDRVLSGLMENVRTYTRQPDSLGLDHVGLWWLRWCTFAGLIGRQSVTR